MLPLLSKAIQGKLQKCKLKEDLEVEGGVGEIIDQQDDPTIHTIMVGAVGEVEDITLGAVDAELVMPHMFSHKIGQT